MVTKIGLYISIVVILIGVIYLGVRTIVRREINKRMLEVIQVGELQELHKLMNESTQLLDWAALVGLKDDIKAFHDTCDIKGYTLGSNDD